MTTRLIPPNEALQEAAAERPAGVPDVVVLEGQWLDAPEAAERVRRYDRLIDSMYEWLEARGSTSTDPLLERTIRQAEDVQDHLHGSTAETPLLP